VTTILYLYGFVPEASPQPDPTLHGLDGTAIELLSGPGFRCVVSRLAAEEYTPETVEARLREVPWVAERAVAHERVVAWFVDHTDIVPARLLTLYSSEAVLEEAAVSERERIAGLLRRFAGLREWDLKVSYHAEALSGHIAELSASVAELDRDIEAAAPGRRFLLSRKREDLVRTELARAARTQAASLLEELRTHARDVVRLGGTSAEVELPVALNAALLVAAGDTATLRQAAARLRPQLEAQGFVVSLSGPWAPYRFMSGGNDE
jgi:hypothetical protein